ARGMAVGRELHSVRKDGTQFPVEISLTPIGSGDDSVVVAVISDITAIKQAQAYSEANLRAVIDNAAQAYVLMDRDKKVILANRLAEMRAEAVFGRKILPGDSFTEFLTDLNRDDFESNFSTALHGGTATSERSFVTPRGETRYFEFRYFAARAADGEL